jgi:hypothetical protein
LFDENLLTITEELKEMKVRGLGPMASNSKRPRLITDSSTCKRRRKSLCIKNLELNSNNYDDGEKRRKL